MSKLQGRSKLIYQVDTQSLRLQNRRNPHIKAITNEKHHSIEWKRCKNHDDVWSVIGASQSSGDRLFFPLSMGAAGELYLRALASDSTGPLPRVPQHPAVFYEVKRDPLQKTRSAINYTLTHSDSPIIYTIASNILFYVSFPVQRERIACFTISILLNMLNDGTSKSCTWWLTTRLPKQLQRPSPSWDIRWTRPMCL